jgi:hypothetical protein
MGGYLPGREVVCGAGLAGKAVMLPQHGSLFGPKSPVSRQEPGSRSGVQGKRAAGVLAPDSVSTARAWTQYEIDRSILCERRILDLKVQISAKCPRCLRRLPRRAQNSITAGSRPHGPVSNEEDPLAC